MAVMQKALDDRNIELHNLENKYEILAKQTKALDIEKTAMGMEISRLNGVVSAYEQEIQKISEQNGSLIQSNQSKSEQMNELNKTNIELTKQHEKDIHNESTLQLEIFRLRNLVKDLEQKKFLIQTEQATNELTIEALQKEKTNLLQQINTLKKK
ncbi:MAG: hypothetical protein LE169_03870 [Endomicrobium sp.]|nr:hypothetical protein [Endomicrobium sp.]MCA6080010.1 hypothetical protein [Endomicrobium sp.]